MKVDLSCPIELWEYVLPTEEKPACLFTFFNLGERVISSIQIALVFYDESGAVVARKTERPMALAVASREKFIVEIETAEKNIDSVEPVSYTHLTLPTT